MPTINFKLPEKIAKYTKQMEFIDTPSRYTAVEATTKAGKTVGCIVWLYREATQGVSGDNYWWIAPIYPQSKIAYRRMKRYIKPRGLFQANDSEQTIKLVNGATIFFKGADKPDSLYGDDVKALVIDEASRVKEEAWFACRSVVTATRGRMKLIGNVKGIDNWFYKLAREAERGRPDWSYFKITAADAVRAGVLAQAEIDDAEQTLPRGIFLELYYAIPFVNSSNKFAFCFEEDKHIRKTQFNPAYPLYISFDFNRNPICATVFQHYVAEDGVQEINAIECIKLPNSNIYHLCDQLLIKYPKALYVINGDSTGKASNALVLDNLNYYVVIREKLGISSNQIKVPTFNPPIQENQLLVNAILEHVRVNIDPDRCQGLIHDLKFVEMLPDGTIKKGDRTDPTQQADALDTFRYYLNVNFKHYLKVLKQAA